MLYLTDIAAEKVKDLIEQKKESNYLGIRIGLKSGGCGGNTYKFEYATSKKDSDEEFSDKGINIFVDKKAMLFLIGTTIDYVENDFSGGFIFINPNAKKTCGCNKSFSA